MTVHTLSIFLYSLSSRYGNLCPLHLVIGASVHTNPLNPLTRMFITDSCSSENVE